MANVIGWNGRIGVVSIGEDVMVRFAALESLLHSCEESFIDLGCGFADALLCLQDQCGIPECDEIFLMVDADNEVILL